MAEGQTFYDEHEAEEILRVASQKSGLDGGMTRDRLLATAQELGISPEAVDAAERQVRETREEALLRGQYAAEVRRSRWAGVSSWLGGSVVLFGINLLTEGFQLWGILGFWCWWPIGIWGLVEAGGFVARALRPEEGFQQWRTRRERRERRRNRRDEPDFDDRIEELVEDALEDALGDGRRRNSDRDRDD